MNSTDAVYRIAVAVAEANAGAKYDPHLIDSILCLLETASPENIVAVHADLAAAWTDYEAIVARVGCAGEEVEAAALALGEAAGEARLTYEALEAVALTPGDAAIARGAADDAARLREVAHAAAVAAMPRAIARTQKEK